MEAFFLPRRTDYVSVRDEDQHPSHRETFKYPWNEPKVVVGAARGSRDRWRVKAASDSDGLVFSQRFVSVWPNRKWSIDCLAAVINGPVASAFVATRETGRDNRTRTIREIPLPNLSDLDLALLDLRARKLLLHIDATLLRGYDLSPRLERAVRDFFQGQRRPVGHEFDDYFPATFKPTILLCIYIRHDFLRCNARHFLENIPNIEDADLMEALSDVE
jgi:hypothetical protein